MTLMDNQNKAFPKTCLDVNIKDISIGHGLYTGHWKFDTDMDKHPIMHRALRPGQTVLCVYIHSLFSAEMLINQSSVKEALFNNFSISATSV